MTAIEEVPDSRSGSVPDPHPSVGRSVLVPRLGYSDRRLEPLLERSDIRLMARSLTQEAARPQLGLLRYGSDVGLVLDPECWRNEVAPGERPSSFRRLRYSLASRRFSPDFEELDEEELRVYAEAVVDEQLEFGATLIITPHHHVRDFGSTSRGRATELRLAECVVNYFHAEGLSEPGPREPVSMRRKIYGGLVVCLEDLNSEVSAQLQALYAALNVDGYWVRISNLSETSLAAKVLIAAGFLLGLQQLSGRPVVLAGGGNLHLAFLASGLAGACIGMAENERFSFPSPKPSGPRILPAYHRLMLRSFHPARSHAREVFEAFGCDCGFHPPELPPLGPEIKSHAFACRTRDAVELTTGSVPEREAHLEARIETAKRAASLLGKPPPRVRTWFAVAAGNEGVQQAKEEQRRAV